MKFVKSNGSKGEKVLILAEMALLGLNLCVCLKVEPRNVCAAALVSGRMADRVQPLRHVASFVAAEGAAECTTRCVCV